MKEFLNTSDVVNSDESIDAENTVIQNNDENTTSKCSLHSITFLNAIVLMLDGLDLKSSPWQTVSLRQ